jgi:hypothetical protein
MRSLSDSDGGEPGKDAPSVWNLEKETPMPTAFGAALVAASAYRARNDE